MIDQIALFIGYAVIAVGTMAATALAIYLPIDYVWRRYGDVAGLIKVVREAKRQGRPVFKRKEPSHDNQ